MMKELGTPTPPVSQQRLKALVTKAAGQKRQDSRAKTIKEPSKGWAGSERAPEENGTRKDRRQESEEEENKGIGYAVVSWTVASSSLPHSLYPAVPLEQEQRKGKRDNNIINQW